MVGTICFGLVVFLEDIFRTGFHFYFDDVSLLSRINK